MSCTPSASTSVRRSSRIKAPKPAHDIPFPEGLADPNKPLEVLVQDLNQGRFASEMMSRVDDFLVRAMFETKRVKKRPMVSETPKFLPSSPIPNALALEIAQDWKVVKASPISEWTDRVDQMWETRVVPQLPRIQYCLQVEDKEFFVKSLVRYGLIYHPDSPVELTTVRFPGVEQNHRGVRAKQPISAGSCVLQMGGWVSGDPVDDGMERLSVMRCSEKGRKEYNGLLAGPSRFINHRCKPNCEFRRLVDPPTTKELHAFAVITTTDIKAGDELTLDYGKEYFQGQQHCLCKDCVPWEDQSMEGSSRISPPPKKRKTAKRYHRRLRPDDGTAAN
ncbi:Histone-lysine N-methyltransferase set9 [Tulasnella sp. 403]|nr:Histone-lysine N-methyltransferase set9 [Tulasnella sp. 403]